MHFVLLGAALFLLHGLVGGDGAEGGRTIVLGDRFIEGLAADHARRTGTPPDEAKRRALTEGHIRQEVLYREAKRLGLDRGDPIVRQRLVQKMEFYLEGTAPIPEPSDEELRAYLSEHAERYERAPRVAFRHVFFDPDRRGGDAEQDARRALRSLQGAGPASAPEGLGDPFLPGLEVGPRSADRIAHTFGGAFADALHDLPTDTWTGPVRSAYGFHLVRITERRPGGVPPLDQVRQRVRAEWVEDRRAEAVRRAVRDLVGSYDIRWEKNAEPRTLASEGRQ